MKLLSKLFFLLLLFNSVIAQAQCDVEETIVVCDMTIIDGDTNGTPDGILNLYDAYFNQTGITIQQGTWVDPNFGFVLDGTTGDLNLWDLNGASENTDDYTYYLFNNDCGASTPALTLHVVLGPFSGNALPPVGVNSVNLQVCVTGDVCVEMESFDLFEALQSEPSPHLNGTWVYEGSSPNFVSIEGSNLSVNVPYQPGPPLVDEETFELVYVVPGITPCSVEQRTTVNVSVVRQASSGVSVATPICEDEIINGLYDSDINLSNDIYLTDEDIEGTWSGNALTGSEISSPSDNIVNIRTLYNNLIATNPRFGSQVFNFRYEVDQRSAVCSDLGSDIPFIVFEALREFDQPEERTICIDQDTPATINLIDEIEFTTENGVLYDYQPGDFAVWEFVSGPEQTSFTEEGELTLTNLQEGSYVFRYTVDPNINCGGECQSLTYDSKGCSSVFDGTNACSPETALVTINLAEALYPGEDTSGVEICRSDDSIILISLLETNGTDEVYTGPNGVWTDGGGNTISNDFVAPAIDGQQTFDFTYTTTNNNCIVSATLSLTIYEQYNAGIGTTTDFCSSDAAINLFDLLTDNPSETGTWSGPEGYNESHLGAFDPAIQVSGNYIYTVPENGTCPSAEAIITVTVNSQPNAGADFSIEVCKSDGLIDLFVYLEDDVDGDGEFSVTATNMVVEDGFLDLIEQTNATLEITYTIDRSDACSAETASVTIQINDVVAPPVVENQSFCILEGPVLSDLEVTTSSDFNWYDSETSDVALTMDSPLVTNTYYVANTNTDGCESARIPVQVKVAMIGETDSCKPELQDGVSPNGDNLNDSFDISELEVSFPNYNLSIYNRNGVIVYKGKIGTPYFSGLNNVSPSLGKDLPSGVYFYVFEPNDAINSPFQDTFYLSK